MPGLVPIRSEVGLPGLSAPGASRGVDNRRHRLAIKTGDLGKLTEGRSNMVGLSRMLINSGTRGLLVP